MDLKEYSQFDATGLAELVANGSVSAQELARTALSAIEKVNPSINAVIEVWHDRIDELDETRLSQGPFRGVPFLLKDLGPRIEGRRQDGGSLLTQGYVADYTHFVSQKMMDSGLNILGRTTCPEFGVTGTTESRLTGITRNPWNLERIAGGSSGGSAAAVAAGVVPMAHSNDGGGSIRIPAAICGNVGLKHSRGLISYAPDGCDLSFPLFSEGVNARSVRDIAGFLDAVRGPAPGEPIVFIEPERSYVEEAQRHPPDLRIGLCASSWGEHGFDKRISSELTRLGKACEDLGHTVTECSPALDFDMYFNTFRQIWCIDIAVMLEAESAAMSRPLNLDTLEPVTLKMYEEGIKATAAERLAVSFQLSQLSRQLGGVFQDYDVLLTPVLGRETPPVGSDAALSDDSLTLDDWFANNIPLIPVTPLNNLTGTPAISLPLCTYEDGMPLGAHFMAPVGRDDLLINLAAQLEAAMPWKEHNPPMHVASDI